MLLIMVAIFMVACAPAEEPAGDDTTDTVLVSDATEPALEAAVPTNETEPVVPTIETEPVVSPTDVPADSTEVVISDPYPVEASNSAETTPQPDPYPAESTGSEVVETEVPTDPYPAEEGKSDETDAAATSGAAPELVLEGVVWELATIIEGNVANSLIKETSISAEFAAARVSGSAGCNTYNAGYTQKGKDLTISEIATTRIGCKELIGQQEARFIEAMLGTRNFIIEGGVLTLNHDGGALQFSQSSARDVVDETSEPAVPDKNLQIQPAIIDDFQIDVNGAAKTATITLFGNYRNGCSKLHGTNQELEGENVISFTMLVEQPLDAICTQALVPFEEVFVLDIKGLESGTYEIFANNLNGEFRLDY